MKSKLLCVLVLACVFVQAIQAQTTIQPSNPNDACAAAWQQYEKGDKLWKTGWGLFGIGSGLTILGGALAGYYGNNPPLVNGVEDYAVSDAGAVLMGVGLGSLITSIPCICVGQVE